MAKTKKFPEDILSELVSSLEDMRGDDSAFDTAVADLEDAFYRALDAAQGNS